MTKRVLVLIALIATSTAQAKSESSCTYLQSDESNKKSVIYSIYSQMMNRQYEIMKQAQETTVKPERRGQPDSVRFSDVLDAMPQILILNNDVDFIISDIPSSTMMVEGFYKAKLKREDYVLVPFLGIGVDVSKYDVMYFCLEYSPVERERQVTFIPMEPTFPSRNTFFREVFRHEKIVYRPKLVSININPVKGAANLIEKILDNVPGLNRIYSEINDEVIQKMAEVIDYGWLMLRKWTVDFGVYQLVVKPKHMELNYKVKIFNIDTLPFRKSRIILERETPLLQDAMWAEESRDLDPERSQSFESLPQR